MEDGDLLQVELGELFNDQFGLVVVRGADVEHQVVEGLAQCLGTGQRRDEGNLGSGGQRQGRQRRGRADVAEQRKHIFLDEFFGIRLAARRLIAVVQGLEHNRHATDTARRIDGIEIGFGAELHLQPELSRRACERYGLAEHDGLAVLGSRGDGGQRQASQRKLHLSSVQHGLASFRS